jgi:predicted ATPase
MGNSLHFRGNQPEARRYFEHILVHYDGPSGVLRSIWFLYDMRVAVQLVLARVLLLQGQVDQAMTHAQASLEHAREADHKLSVCYTIAWAVFPIELMTGDFAAAERSVATLIDIATRQSFSYWTNIGHCLEGELLIKRGHYATGTAMLRAALESYVGTGWATRYSEFLGVLAEGVAGLGQISEALTLIGEALTWSDRTGEAYYAPELLRLKGEMLLLREAEDRSVLAAEECFHRARAQAREQGALFWELQVALSLARLCKQQNREDEARQVLAPVCDRFPDGPDIADLRSARDLLASLSC